MSGGGLSVFSVPNAELPVMPSTGQIEDFDGIPFGFAGKWTRHYRSYSAFLFVILSVAKDQREAMRPPYGFAKLCIVAIPYIDR